MSAAFAILNRPLVKCGDAYSFLAPTTPIRREAVVGANAGPTDAQIFSSAPALLCLAYFFLQAIATVGWMTFGPTALSQAYGVPLVAAAAIITAYFVGSISGTFAGGFGAALATHHSRVIAGCVVTAAIAMGFIATG